MSDLEPLRDFCESAGGKTSSVTTPYDDRDGLECQLENGSVSVTFSKYGPRIDIEYDDVHKRSYEEGTGEMISEMSHVTHTEELGHPESGDRREANLDILEERGNDLVIAEDGKIVESGRYLERVD